MSLRIRYLLYVFYTVSFFTLLYFVYLLLDTNAINSVPQFIVPLIFVQLIPWACLLFEKIQFGSTPLSVNQLGLQDYKKDLEQLLHQWEQVFTKSTCEQKSVYVEMNKIFHRMRKDDPHFEDFLQFFTHIQEKLEEVSEMKEKIVKNNIRLTKLTFVHCLEHLEQLMKRCGENLNQCSSHLANMAIKADKTSLEFLNLLCNDYKQIQLTLINVEQTITTKKFYFESKNIELKAQLEEWETLVIELTGNMKKLESKKSLIVKDRNHYQYRISQLLQALSQNEHLFEDQENKLHQLSHKWTKDFFNYLNHREEEKPASKPASKAEVARFPWEIENA